MSEAAEYEEIFVDYVLEEVHNYVKEQEHASDDIVDDNISTDENQLITKVVFVAYKK